MVGIADLIVVIWLALAALSGFRRGLTAQMLSLGGLVLGAYLGSQIAPEVLTGGSNSPWTPLASIVGALVGALLLQVLAGFVGGVARRLILPGPLKAADSAGGVFIGTLTGLGIAWLIAVLALNQPAVGLQRHVERSAILSTIVDEVPPSSVLNRLGTFDPLPLLSGLPDIRLPKPDASVPASGIAREASDSVVKVIGTSCDFSVQGTGWVIEPGLVATNAHVIAGQDDTKILTESGQRLRATIVYLDTHDDVALLQVEELVADALPLARRVKRGESVVMLGHARGGDLRAKPGTAGRPVKIISPDATNSNTGFRTVVPLRGEVLRGDSGGPVLNQNSEVVAMMFGATREGVGGVGVPLIELRQALESLLQPVDSGPCIR